METPSTLIKLSVASVIDDVVQLAWDSEVAFRSYQVVLNDELGVERQRILVSDVLNASVANLNPGQTYSFRVRGLNGDEWSEYSSPVYAKIQGHTNTSQQSMSMGLLGGILGGVIGGVVLLVIIIIVITLFYLRKLRKPASCNNSTSDCDILKYVNATMNKTFPQVQNNTTSSQSTLKSGESFHIYADPLSIDSEATMLSLKSLEIHPSYLTVGKLLNKTWSGELYSGLLSTPDKRMDRSVTIETIKSDANFRGRKADVRVAVGVLNRLNHANIIKTEGFFMAPQTTIVYEYMAHACLRDFLKKKTSPIDLTLHRLVNMSQDIVSGMSYLHERGIIHQVPEDLIRWMAPEVLCKERTSCKSDVWMFGVVIWQMMSRGEDPYCGWMDDEVDDCPPAMYQLMLQCWRLDKNTRPDFNNIKRVIETLLEQIFSVEPSRNQVLHNSVTALNNNSNLGITFDNSLQQHTTTSIAKIPNNNNVGLPPVGPQQCNTVVSEYPYLAMYWGLLQSKGYTNLPAILQLEDPALLTSCGITSPSHQFFLLNEIQKLRHRGADSGQEDCDSVDHFVELQQRQKQQHQTHQQSARPISQHANGYLPNSNRNSHSNHNNTLANSKKPPQSQQQQHHQQQQHNKDFSSKQNLLLSTSSQLNLSTNHPISMNQLMNNDNHQPINMSQLNHSNHNNNNNQSASHTTSYPNFCTARPSTTSSNHNSHTALHPDKVMTQRFKLGVSALNTQKNYPLPQQINLDAPTANNFFV
ncbi:hypothetical protein HELRODRAFT_189707 [Helobdella robusta]|uniref:Receptor protein-tyrosine kinase n=1 Tax=Helobdella robusta TaxID=6412 RepID=T1FRA2_HELRO|nr:hypothetical protein HELRODRAFT_189707 [Helobdella robusta]ESN91508.1 hypothetical protein HELRODRAFT_189707 [Helobdella robusta]